MIKKNKPRARCATAKSRPRSKRKRNGLSVPCPKCGARSRVWRTTLGERLRTSERGRDFVVRERRCLSRAHHRFLTEEHTK